MAHQTRRHHPLQQATENASDSDVDLEHPERVGAVLNHALESHIVDADYFTPLRIDDLLIEKVSHHAQHILVGMVRCEVLIAKMDPVERDGSNLVVANRQPRRPYSSDQVAIDANGIDQRYDGGIFNHTDPAPFEVEDLEAQNFGEEQKLFRHRVPESIVLELPRILL